MRDGALAVTALAGCILGTLATGLVGAVVIDGGKLVGRWLARLWRAQRARSGGERIPK